MLSHQSPVSCLDIDDLQFLRMRGIALRHVELELGRKEAEHGNTRGDAVSLANAGRGEKASEVHILQEDCVVLQRKLEEFILSCLTIWHKPESHYQGAAFLFMLRGKAARSPYDFSAYPLGKCGTKAFNKNRVLHLLSTENFQCKNVNHAALLTFMAWRETLKKMKLEFAVNLINCIADKPECQTIHEMLLSLVQHYRNNVILSAPLLSSIVYHLSSKGHFPATLNDSDLASSPLESLTMQALVEHFSVIDSSKISECSTLVINYTPVNIDSLMKNNYSSLWDSLLNLVNHPKLAAMIIHRTLKMIKSGNYYPNSINHFRREAVLIKLIRLLNHDDLVSVLEHLLKTLPWDKPPYLVRIMLHHLAKKTDVTTTNLAIAYFFEPANQALLEKNSFSFSTLLALAKRIDTKGDQLLLPLLLKLLNIEKHYLPVKNKRYDFPEIFEFIYPLRQSISHFFYDHNITRSLTHNLNSQQILTLWQYLTNITCEHIKDTEVYSKLITLLARKITPYHLDNLRQILQFSSENGRLDDAFFSRLINKIKKYHSQSTSIPDSIHEVIQTILDVAKTQQLTSQSLQSNFIDLVHVFTKKGLSNVLEITLVIIANGDSNLYAMLQDLKMDNAVKALKVTYDKNYLIIPTIQIFSTLDKTDDYIKIIPLLLSWADMPLESFAYIRWLAMTTLLDKINLLTPTQIQSLHLAIVTESTHKNFHDEYWHSIINRLPQLLFVLSNQQKIELFTSISSTTFLDDAQLQLLIKLIEHFKVAEIIDPVKLLVPHKHLQVELGSYLPAEHLIAALPEASTVSFEDFILNYLNTYDFPQFNHDVISDLHYLVNYIKRFNDAPGISNELKRLHFVTLINKMAFDINCLSPLTIYLSLMQLSIDCQEPDFAFIFPAPQSENCITRFRILFNSIVPAETSSSLRYCLEDLANLNHPYAALLIVDHLAHDAEITKDKTLAINYIQNYCQLVSNIERLDELTQLLLNSRNNLLMPLFKSDTSTRPRQHYLHANRLNSFGIFRDVFCSHAIEEIFLKIEQRKRALQNAVMSATSKY